jgi:hypothetical protein
MADLSKMGIADKARIVGKNQKLIAQQIYEGDDKAGNVFKSSQELVKNPNMATMKIFENNFDMWYADHEDIIETEDK